MEIKRRNFLNRLGTGVFAASAAIPLISAKPDLSSGPIQKDEIMHMVIFDLIHEKGQEQAGKFLKDGQRILSKIPGVQNFQVLDSKNNHAQLNLHALRQCMVSQS